MDQDGSGSVGSLILGAGMFGKHPQAQGGIAGVSRPGTGLDDPCGAIPTGIFPDFCGSAATPSQAELLGAPGAPSCAEPHLEQHFPCFPKAPVFSFSIPLPPSHPCSFQLHLPAWNPRLSPIPARGDIWHSCQRIWSPCHLHGAAGILPTSAHFALSPFPRGK